MATSTADLYTFEDFIVSGPNKITYADVITVVQGNHKNITIRNTYGAQVLYHSKIDLKGRLYLPAEVQAFLGKSLYITMFDKDCLAMYSAERWKALLDKINALPVSPKQKKRPLINYSKNYEMDNRGYIYIPKKLRERVRLTSSVTIAMYNKTQNVWDGEIWATKKWDSYVADKI